MVSVFSVTTVMAANTHIEHDVDFTGASFNLHASSDNAAKAAFNSATGWRVDDISGVTTVSAVDAATELGSDPYSLGTIMKIAGGVTTADAADLRITVPRGTWTTEGNDTFHVVFDMYISPESPAIKMQIFGDTFEAYQYLTNINYSASTGNSWFLGYRYRPTTAANIAADTTGAHTGFISYNNSKVVGNWHRVEYIYDLKDVTPLTLPKTSTDSTLTEVIGYPSLTVKITDLETNTLKYTNKSPTNISPIVSANLRNDSFFIGRPAGMAGTAYIDNVKIFSQDKLVIKHCADEGKTISVDQPYVDVEMSVPVNPASLSSVSINNGATVSASMVNDKTVRVTFTSGIDFDTEYKINFSGITSTSGLSFGSLNNKVTFTTESKPDLTFESSTLYKHSALGNAVVVTEIDADDSVYTVLSEVKNNSGSAKNVTVLHAIYDANGNLVDSVLTSKSVAGQSTANIGTGISVGAGLAGGKIRTFLWNNMDMMQAYVRPVLFAVSD